MSRDLTRRQILGQAGTLAAGAAGLGLAACSSTGTHGAGSYSADASMSASRHGLEHFVTEPDLVPPVTNIIRHGLGPDRNKVFTNAPFSGTGHGGSIIREADGGLIWMGRNTPKLHRMNFDKQTYKGKPVLTWWEGTINTQGWGSGVGVVADSSYRTLHKFHAGDGLSMDHHELNLTDQGTALVTIFHEETRDLRSVGGPRKGIIVVGICHEIDVATGHVVFSWNSLDHVAMHESYQKMSPATREHAWDYFHINSVAVAPDGDLLISGRNTWCVYKVSRRTGKVVWRLGGKKSDFKMGPGSRFAWQHHVRPHGNGAMTVFDNAAFPAEARHSRAILLDVSLARRHVSLRHQYVHPHRSILAGAMGSAQLMPDGRMFVGWGSVQYYSEFSADGKLLLDAEMSATHPSYRAFSYDWTGQPTTGPTVVAHHRSGGAALFASWNGATDIASWVVLAGKSRSALASAGTVRREGFETTIDVRKAGPWFAVEARNSRGHVLGRSQDVHIAH